METLNPSYIGPRNDIVKLIPHQAKRVLDVGCGIGALGKQLKQQRSVEVIGIEIDGEMAALAEDSLDKVIIADVEQINFSDYFQLEYFNSIIFGDIIEHLKDPWTVLNKTTKFLCKNGVIIASIPNIRHYTTIINLLITGYWPYRERGIHDKNHLRFFTLRNIHELFHKAGLRIVKIKRNYRIIETPNRYNVYAKYLALPLLRDFLTFQYLIVSVK